MNKKEVQSAIRYLELMYSSMDEIGEQIETIQGQLDNLFKFHEFIREFVDDWELEAEDEK